MATYGHDENKNKVEVYNKEELLQLLADMIEAGTLDPSTITADNPFVTHFKNIVDGNAYGIAFCTQAEYNEMEQGGTLEENVIYYITDDETFEDLEELVNDLSDQVEQLDDDVTALDTRVAGAEGDIDKLEDGTTPAGKVGHTLSFGNKGFDGSANKTLYIYDLIDGDGFSSIVTLSDGYIYILRCAHPSNIGEIINFGVVSRVSGSTMDLPEIGGLKWRIYTNGRLQYSYDGSSWDNASNVEVITLGM